MNNFFIIFNKYYKHIIFFFILIFFCFLSFLYFENLKNNQIKKDGRTYINFLLSSLESQNQTFKELEDLKLIAKNKNHFSDLAKISIAQNFIAQSNFLDAKIELEKIINEKKSNKILKNYAILIYSKILISEKKFHEFNEIKEKYKIFEPQNDFTFKLNLLEFLIISYIETNQLNQAYDLIEKNKINMTENQKTIFERIKQNEIFIKYNQ